jgi:4-hydroxy-2-oxoglutarate aldolase
MNMETLQGIFPPLPTSFDENEELDAGRMRENIRSLSRYDLAGFLILGSNGELVMLTEEEKIRVFNQAREAIPGDRLMLAGTGGQSTRETIRLTREAARAGADAVLVLNPHYYKGLMGREALVAHYHAVADASGVPVIIYNMPGNTGMDMGADDILAIADHDNIVGMKDSGGNVVKMGEVLRRARPGFRVLAGSAGFLLPALAMGATGGILALANIAPAQCLGIYQSFREGDLERARQLQQQMIPVNTAVTARWGVPALKAAMDHLGLYGGPARRPVLPLSAPLRQELLALLEAQDIRQIDTP